MVGGQGRYEGIPMENKWHWIGLNGSRHYGLCKMPIEVDSESIRLKVKIFLASHCFLLRLNNSYCS